MAERLCNVWLMNGRKFREIVVEESEMRTAVTNTFQALARGRKPEHTVRVETLHGEIIVEPEDMWVAENTFK